MPLMPPLVTVAVPVLELVEHSQNPKLALTESKSRWQQ
jgi:hypothetical protein